MTDKELLELAAENARLSRNAANYKAEAQKYQRLYDEAEAKLQTLRESGHALEVAANTAIYCYDKRPENFAFALAELETCAEHFRTTTTTSTTPAPIPEGWISVKDRLPELNMQVLVFTGGLMMQDELIEYTEQDTGYKEIEFGYPDCTHWMPLPAAPKGE